MISPPPYRPGGGQGVGGIHKWYPPSRSLNFCVYIFYIKQSGIQIKICCINSYYNTGPRGPTLRAGPGGWIPTLRPRPHGVGPGGVDIAAKIMKIMQRNSLKDPKLIKIDQILLHTANITPFLGGGPSWAVILIETKIVHILPIFSHGNDGHPPIGP